MGIKDKQTYGEYYWAMQVEAQAARDEEIENTLAPYIRGLLGDLRDFPALPPGMQTFIDALRTPPSAELAGVMVGMGINAIDEILDNLFSGSMTMLKRDANRTFQETWLTSQQVNTLYQRKKITEEYWDSILYSEGYEPEKRDFLYKSQLPYPSIPDLVLYSRYHGDPDNIWSTLQEFYNIDPVDFKLWEWLGKQRISVLQAQQLFARGIYKKPDIDEELRRIGWADVDIDAVRELSWTIPNAMLLVQGGLIAGVDDSEILKTVSRAMIHPDHAQAYLDAVLTKPSTQDIIAFELRKDPSLSNLPSELRKIGIHDSYSHIYRELAYMIPPVGDIITMAVREAFTPTIAERFGQYEDFPPEFEQWAAKKGLTAEWSKRYWASHWTLPSASQGFEMLHRGVIGTEELNMLLRALDIMPFWRDRLTRVAFKRLTRVDIRRMYRVGVLTEEEVYEAYLELGYNKRDARRMSDFTVKQTLATQSKFTSRDIVSAYSKRMITRSEARSLLLMVDVKRENIEFILSTADYKRKWELTDDRIAGIRNLFRKHVYDSDTARGKLLRLDMPAEQVDVLMDQWHYEKGAEPSSTWTAAQTLKFVKTNLISPERAQVELDRMGYDAEHIDILMRIPE